MTLKKRLLLVLIFITSNSFLAQTPKLTKKDSTSVSYWLVGLGYNFIDDSGDVFNNLFNVNESWNAVPYPSRISVGKYFKNGFGVEFSAAYNNYRKGSRVDKEELDENKSFFSTDARLSYDLNKIIGNTGWFDPYIGAGLGYTRANSEPRGTYNAVVGFRTWFSDKIGLDINLSGKWAMNFDIGTTNYKQYAAGIVYKFGNKKELTTKGEDKLALIKELELEAIRKNDSIALAQKALEENRLKQERIEEEKESTRIAKLEKEKQDAINKKKEEIQNAINTLDKILFNFDSSNLNSDSKKILLELVSILNTYPNLIVEISSHTDSRGTKSYNQTLSEQRLKSIIKYLLDNKVLEKKVIGKAYGEEKLLNECDDYTKCTNAKHLENRRAEVNVVDLKK